MSQQLPANLVQIMEQRMKLIEQRSAFLQEQIFYVLMKIGHRDTTDSYELYSLLESVVSLCPNFSYNLFFSFQCSMSRLESLYPLLLIGRAKNRRKNNINLLNGVLKTSLISR
jgi:hypothetical protein